MTSIFYKTGSTAKNIFLQTVNITMFILRVILNLFSPPYYGKEFFKQVINIGYYSLPIVSFTALFAGAVLALQSHSGFASFSAESAVPLVIVIAITAQLGPVFTGLMVSGRSGASIAAEIGTMKVSEQIDALKTLGVQPFKYLIVPRVLAATIMLPVLTIFADIIGIFGGFIVSVKALGFNPYVYINHTIENLVAMDVYSGLIKSAVFGFIISVVACYQGYHTSNGAEGVGKSTKTTVVISSVLVLISNYLLTAWLFS